MNKKFRNSRVFFLGVELLAVLLFGMLFVVEQAKAVPVFSRKYKTSCSTCHEMAPRLNAFGEAFRLAGFRWPERDKQLKEQTEREQRKEEPLPMGAEAYKQVWPKAIWPGDIPSTVPLAIRGRFHFTDQRDQNELRYEWELFAAGTMGDAASFFGHANFFNTFGPDQISARTIQSVGWFQLDRLAKSDLLYLQLGIVGFEEEDLPDYRTHSTWRLTESNPFFNTMAIPYPTGFAKQNVYMIGRGPGAMLQGHTSRFRYALGEKSGNDTGGGTKGENTFLQLNYKIGGMDFYGRTKKPQQFGYLDDSLSLGFLAVRGRSNVIDPTQAQTNDRFWRVGFDTKWKRGSNALIGGTLFGTNNNPYGTINRSEVKVRSWFVHGERFVYPWLLSGIRYEQERIDVPANLQLGERKRARVVPFINVQFRANIRFALEANVYTRPRRDFTGRRLDRFSLTPSIDFIF